MKTCTKCKTEKPATTKFFRKRLRYKSGLNTQCRQCENEYRHRRRKQCPGAEKRYNAKYRRDHKDKIREYQQTQGLRNKYKYKYGITIEQYDDMLLLQGGRCAICGKHQVEFEQRLSVDHDHVTSEVRGLLCVKCNVGIGMLDDSVANLESAVEYLK